MAKAGRFGFQCRMLEKGFGQIQYQIARLDDIAFRVKAGAATVWVALMGWSITGKSEALVPLGFLVILGFWLLEAMFRGIQFRYIAKSRELSEFLNDKDALDACFEKREFPPGLIYPVGLRTTEWANLARFLRGITSATVATLYLFLGLANVLLWFALDLVL